MHKKNILQFLEIKFSIIMGSRKWVTLKITISKIMLLRLFYCIQISNELGLVFSEPQADNLKSEPEKFCAIRPETDTESTQWKIVNFLL